MLSLLLVVNIRINYLHESVALIYSYEYSFYILPLFYHLQVFSGSATSGNVTVPSTDAMYGVQVTASIPVGDSLNEGRISNLSLVDVPTPGILTY